jgi:drug/metabolite transporter (DMT)-like permease
MTSFTRVSLLLLAASTLRRYGSNVGVLLLNKYLLSVYGFKFPAFLTLAHMLACSIMSYALAISGTVSLQPVKSRRQFYKIATLAIVFCVAVVLGNVSLKFIPVSFNQAIGATTPAFTALLAALMLGHRETKSVYLSLVPVIIGIVIASGAEPMFNVVGFCAALTATAARALKSVLQGLMLSDSSEKMDSLSLLLYMAPVATAALVPITLYFEPTALANALVLGQTGQGFWPLLVVNAVMAYFVNLTNFLVTKHTSALTLQVLGNAKGVVAVIASVLVFRNPVTFYTVLGYLVTVSGVILYSHAKRQSKKTEALKKLAAKVSDMEQPRSPFSSAATAESRLLLDKNDSTGNGHTHNRSLSTSFSDKLMPRGFSSLWEA